MTVTTYGMAFQSETRRVRSRGIDRLIERIGLALQLWARRRARHSAPSHDEMRQRLAVERELASRDGRLGRYGIVG